MTLGSRTRGRHRGFTLLEAMVAVAVLSLIVLSAFGALRLGARSWEAGLERTGATEHLRLLQDNVRRQLSQAIALRLDPADPRRIGFEGSREGMRFVAPAPQQSAGAGLYDFELRAERTEHGVRLVLYYQAHDPEAEGFEDSDQRREVVLADGLKEVTLDYFGALKQTDSPDWHDTWQDDAEQLPALVRVQAEAEDAARPWPELVVAIAEGGGI